MSKYKGMRRYGVTTKNIKEYASEHNLNPTDLWKKVIDKFVNNRAMEYEGYTDNCFDCYVERWEQFRYCGVDSSNEIFHTNVMLFTIISVKELLEDMVDVTPTSDLRCMNTFPMSSYKNLEELYKDKSNYLEHCLSKLMEHCIHSGLVVTDDDGNYVNIDDGSYVMEDTRQ
jgi:hypothetical protein